MTFWIESVGHAQDDEPSAFSRVEDGGTVGEAARFAAEFTQLAVFEIEDFNRLDG